MRTDTATALIAYDGSEDAAAAIRHAGRLLAPRQAVVVYVWESLAGMLLHTDAAGLTGTMREAAAELDEEDRRYAERIAAEGAELAPVRPGLTRSRVRCRAAPRPGPRY